MLTKKNSDDNEKEIYRYMDELIELLHCQALF